MAKPGPRTAAGKARALANLEPPEEAPLTHGLYRWLSRAMAPPCDRCIVSADCEQYKAGATCAIAEGYRDSIIRDVNKLPHIEPMDGPLVREYAQLVTAARIFDAYLGEASPFLPGADKGYIEPQPALVKTRLALTNSALRIASELGLTPLARKRLREHAETQSTQSAFDRYRAQKEAVIDVQVEGGGAGD